VEVFLRMTKSKPKKKTQKKESRGCSLGDKSFFFKHINYTTIGHRLFYVKEFNEKVTSK
jgi:hypothetical protein